jgi:hypothetical protein
VPLEAPEQGAALHWCKDALYSTSIIVATCEHSQRYVRNSETCKQGMQHLFIDVRVLNIYSRIKQAQVLDVSCISDDPPILVLDHVCPWSEHLVNDERPLPRWR